MARTQHQRGHGLAGEPPLQFPAERNQDATKHVRPVYELRELAVPAGAAAVGTDEDLGLQAAPGEMRLHFDNSAIRRRRHHRERLVRNNGNEP